MFSDHFLNSLELYACSCTLSQGEIYRRMITIRAQRVYPQLLGQSQLCSSNFWVCERNPIVRPFKWNLFGSTFAWYHLCFNILQNKIWYFSWITICLAPFVAKSLPWVPEVYFFSENRQVWVAFMRLCSLLIFRERTSGARVLKGQITSFSRR